MLQELNRIFDRESDRFIEQWKELLRFASISAQPEHEDDCRRCAQWLAAHLESIGLPSRLLETGSKPVVYAEYKGRSDKPTLLFYGHYDVQPVDPIERWFHPPFDPALKEGRLYARGAQDNKGQLFYTLKALETLRTKGKLDTTFKVVLEGEEENGSRGLNASLSQWKELLKADVLMVADTGMAGAGVPAVVVGLRGIVSLTVVLSGPRYDLHSGVHGGVAPNPAQALARLVADLHCPDGSIAVKGFYDGLEEPTAREQELAKSVAMTAEQYTQLIGAPPIAGEKQFDPCIRSGFRPSLDINGIHSGYQGRGAKTIIPAQAIAKITARVVAGQDPDRLLQAIIDHLRRQTPAGLTLNIEESEAAGPGLKLDPDSPLATKAQKVLKQISGQPAAFLWEGASIPIVSSLAKISGAQPLLVGFGLAEDKIHAPDESFSLDQFKLGFLYAASMIASF